MFNYQTWMVKIELDHRLVTTRILQSSHTDTTLFNSKIQLVEIEKRIAVHKYCSHKGLVAIEHIFGLQQELGETMSVEITSSCVQRSPLGCSLFFKNHLFLMDIKPRPSFTDRWWNIFDLRVFCIVKSQVLGVKLRFQYELFDFFQFCLFCLHPSS